MAEQRQRKIKPINLENVSDTFELLPIGRYRVRLAKGTVGVRDRGKNQGCDTVKLVWNVNSEIHPKLKGRKIWDDLDIVEDLLFRVKNFARATGATPAELKVLDIEPYVAKKVEEQVEVEIEYDHYTGDDGKQHGRVKAYHAISDSSPNGATGEPALAGSGTPSSDAPF